LKNRRAWGALQAQGAGRARVYPESNQAASRHADEVRIAFDGDARVLFSDESRGASTSATGLESLHAAMKPRHALENRCRRARFKQPLLEALCIGLQSEKKTTCR